MSPRVRRWGMHAQRNRRWRRIVAVALLCALPWVMFRWFEHAQVYHPTSGWDATGEALGRPWRAVEFKGEDGGILSGWFFPAHPGSVRSHLAVLFCHGNAGNISHRLDAYGLLLELGVNVFTFDYRGYGRSSGRASETGTYRDVEAAFRWLRSQGFAGTNIIASGESLGGGIASHLASVEPLAGLILHSTFTSIPDLGAELFPWLPVRTLARIRYDTKARLPTIQVPVLILHSRGDRMIPFHHAERNLAAANQPKWLKELTGDHNDQPAASPRQFREAIEAFLGVL